LKCFTIKALSKILGAAVTGVAIFYLLATLAENAGSITITFSPALPAAMALFFCMHCIQAAIIQSLLAQKIGFAAAFKIHTVSQIYKYIPGNLGHYFSRWMYLKRYDVQPRENAQLIFYETFFMLAAFGLFGILFIATSPWIHSAPHVNGSAVIAAAGAAGVALAVYVFKKKTGFLSTGKTLSVMLLYCLAAVLSGLIVWILSMYTTPEIAGIGFVRYTLGFAASFVAGFVVPGAPGGIGVREFVFVEIFKHSGAASYLLAQLIILFRLLAVATELLLFFIINIFVKPAV